MSNSSRWETRQPSRFEEQRHQLLRGWHAFAGKIKRIHRPGRFESMR